MKKIRRRSYIGKLKKGDLIRTALTGVPGIHVCIILEDEGNTNLIKCLPICNFTSNPPENADIVIDVSEYDLPDTYFNKKKTTSWLICKENLCTYSSIEYTYLDNLLIKHPKLWETICSASRDWKSNNALTSICDCEKAS